MGQTISFLCLLWGTWQIGILNFSGITNLLKLLARESKIMAEPEGQGPALGSDGRMRATGPFRLSRHPLNFWMIPLLWLMPRMTINLAVFNVAVTVYLLAGSVHEEARLREAYGEAYAEYLASGVSFFIPDAGYLAEPKSNCLLKSTSGNT